jgi:hypothetical protein
MLTQRSVEKDQVRLEKAMIYQFFGMTIARNMGWVLYGVFFIALLIGKYKWAEPIFSAGIGWINLIAFLAIIIGGIVAIIKTIRIFGGITLELAGWLFLFTTHCMSAAVAYTLGGVGWLIAGTLAGGYGVIPVAIVLSFIHKEPGTAWNILFSLAIIAATLIPGRFIVGKCALDIEKKKVEFEIDEIIQSSDPEVQDVDEDRAMANAVRQRLHDADELTRAYGRTLMDAPSLVLPISALPGDKEDIKEDLKLVYHHRILASLQLETDEEDLMGLKSFADCYAQLYRFVDPPTMKNLDPDELLRLSLEWRDYEREIREEVEALGMTYPYPEGG